MAAFELKTSDEDVVQAHGALTKLRERLFNSSDGDFVLPSPPVGRGGGGVGSDGLSPDSSPPAERGSEDELPELESSRVTSQSEIRYYECGDRDTEIRAIAKEVKRLILTEAYNLSDIALVVRQRASYAETIARVMREESMPCNLEARIDAHDIPANRAALKLLSLLEGQAREESRNPRTSELADLIKSEYFRLSEDELKLLNDRFEAVYASLLSDNDEKLEPTRLAYLKRRYRIGVWDADALENAFAYVGSELHVSEWLKRAQKLIKELPGAASTRELLNIGGEQSRDPDEADQVENAETAKVESSEAEKKRRPSRDIHPAAIAWTALVIETFIGHLHAVPGEANPADLRLALMRLFVQLCFREQIAQPIRRSLADQELPQAMLNFNSLEALRRAFAAAIKSIVLTSANEDPISVRLDTFIEEVRRCLNSQSQSIGRADRAGLRVLEATDVRGLRFRAVFVAGLVEGGFPMRASRDWIYPHEERERLKHYGLTLEDISPATLLKEEHYFYQSVCRATERLYLTRPLLLEDDSETVASYYVDELRRAVAPLEIVSESIRRDYDGASLNAVSRTHELNIGLVRQQERHFHRGDKQELLPQPRIKKFLSLSRNDSFLSDSALRRIEIERERASFAFGPYDGEITDPHLLALIKQRFGGDFVHSASSLGIYANCAYRFLGQRILKLEPRGEAALDLQAIDAGKLLHDILRRFFERYRRQPLYTLDRVKLQAELRELADKVFDEHERVVPPLNKQIWKIDREIRKILLDQVLIYELQMQEEAAAVGVVPAYFEVAFGGTRSAARDPNSKDEPLSISRSTFVGEETIRVSGQIDRVDIAKDNTLIAYDYKLSTGSSREDIKSGRSLQLPIYLEALEKLILPDHPIAGGGYYIIRGGGDRRNRGLYRASQAGYTNLQAKNSVFSDEDWQQIRDEVIAKVWGFLDEMRAGKFVVRPAEKEKTCRFCDFKAVCRYDRYRIDRKK
jgi:ATP-dependent helicase/DNAse subunit B